MILAVMLAETSEALPAEGGLDVSALFDWASLAVAVVVGIGSALLTGWIQTARDARNRRAEAVAHLVEYERALFDAVRNLEASEYEYGVDGPAFPSNLLELRIAAYPHYRFLKQGNEEDQEVFWQLHSPGETGGGPTPIAVGIEAYSRSYKAASATIKRVHRRTWPGRLADFLRTRLHPSAP